MIAEYWQIQAKLYHENKEPKAAETKKSEDQDKGLGEFLHAQEQLEHWQSQYPEMTQSESTKSAP